MSPASIISQHTSLKTERTVLSMRRTLLVSGVLPFVTAFLGGALALSVAMPVITEAQEARIRAETVTVVGAGTDRVRLTTNGDGQIGDLSMLAPSGTRRLLLSEGGIDAPDPSSSGITIYAEDGTRVGRLGIGRGPNTNLPVSTALTLNDLSGLRRRQLIVNEDGTPSMLMFDADGAVIWSAP
jgi:hypothetical protein